MRLNRLVGIGAVVISPVAVAFSMVSCRQVIGAEEYAVCSDPSGSQDDCGACTLAKCCATSSSGALDRDAVLTCRDDPECAALDECVRACTSSGDECLSKCRADYPNAAPEAFAALAACRAAECAEPCGIGCGGYLYPDAGCAACATEACCDEATACGSDRGCLALSACEHACASDPPCRADCENHYGPVARDLANAMGSCIANHCGAACDVTLPAAPDWSCLPGEAIQPPGPGPELEIAVSLNVSNFPDGGLSHPFKGASVQACAALDDACGPPVWTDKNGLATLHVPHDFDGYVLTTAPEIVGILLYPPQSWALSPVANPFSYTTNGFEEANRSIAPLDPSRGHVGFTAFDCSGSYVAGLSFSLEPPDPLAIPYYGVHLDTATIEHLEYGGFLNVEPGPRTLVVTRRDTGDCIAQLAVVILAGAETDWYDIPPLGCGAR